MAKIKEIWKNIDGYGGCYQISSLGRVKSLKRDKPIIMKVAPNPKGYLTTALTLKAKSKTYTIHKLVAYHFISERPPGLVIDHINSDKTDNRAINLRYITNRLNNSKDKKNKSSIYTGVAWNKRLSKWKAAIYIKPKHVYLGLFKTQELARDAYNNALDKLTRSRKRVRTYSIEL